MPGYIASTTVTWLVRHYSTGFNAIHAIMYWLAFAADVSCGIPHSHRHMDIGLIYTNRISGTMQKSVVIDGDTTSYLKEEHFKIMHKTQCPKGTLMNRKSASVVVISDALLDRSEENKSDLQSLMLI